MYKNWQFRELIQSKYFAKTTRDTGIYAFCALANLARNIFLISYSSHIVTENKFKTFSSSRKVVKEIELLDIKDEDEERSQEGEREAEWI